MKTRELVCALTFALSGHAFPQNPGDNLFSSSQVHDINIILTQANWWDSLQYYKDLSDQTGQNYYMVSDVIINGTPLSSSGVRLRGNSSYGHPGRKKPIKIDFNQYVQGQEYDGLKSILLNNSSYDPTMLREKLMLDVLNARGLPAPRCTYARVSYNGQYVGLYKVLEVVDKTFLKTHFNNKERNLYKGEPNATLEWEGSNQAAYYDNLELNTNETANDWSDLVNLIDKINNSGSDFRSQVEQVFNLQDYIRSWAANNVFANIDAYYSIPHNYYLYNDSIADVFQWINWDVGLVFGVLPSSLFQSSDQLDIFYLPDPPSSRPLNNNILNVPELKTAYLNAVCDFLNNDLDPNRLFPKIDSLAAVIRPHVYAEPDSNQMYTEAQFEGNLNSTKVPSFLFYNIPGLKSFIVLRKENVVNQLCQMEWSCALGASYSGIGSGIINVYPSPANDELTVYFNVPEYNTLISYRIVDMMGNKVLEEYAPLEDGNYVKKLNTAGLRQGIYMLIVDAACRDVERKILIIR
ncbi:MAG: CotH kinase family protein [Bacteroidota bacterium]